MISMSEANLIKAMMGQGPVETPRLDIPAGWDPVAIRASTANRDEQSETVLGYTKTYLVTGILVLAFIAQLSDLGMLNQVCMGLFTGLLVLSGVGAIMDRFFMDRNERAGNYQRLAEFLFRRGSTYWKYRKFDEDLAVSFKPVAYVAFLATATVALGWYLGLFLLTLTTVANGYVVIMRDTKASSLIRYKETWDAQQVADRLQAEELRRIGEEKDREINEIMAKAGDEEPNALTKDGPVHEDPFASPDKFLDDGS